jgi:hypothetical protein
VLGCQLGIFEIISHNINFTVDMLREQNVTLWQAMDLSVICGDITMTNHTTFGTYFQTTTAPCSMGQVLCVLCAMYVPSAEATVGPSSASGELTFICNVHLGDNRLIINQLADYRAAERQRYMQSEDFGHMDIEGTGQDAWFLY